MGQLNGSKWLKIHQTTAQYQSRKLYSLVPQAASQFFWFLKGKNKSNMWFQCIFQRKLRKHACGACNYFHVCLEGVPTQSNQPDQFNQPDELDQLDKLDQHDLTQLARLTSTNLIRPYESDLANLTLLIQPIMTQQTRQKKGLQVYNLRGGKGAGVWKVSGGCLEGIRNVSRMYQEGVWKMSGRFLEGVWKINPTT